MDKAKLERWLNKIVKAVTQINKIKDFSDTIEICDMCKHGISDTPYFQLYRGIEIIAETLEIGLKIEESDERIIRTFMYNGVMFLQCGRKGE